MNNAIVSISEKMKSQDKYKIDNWKKLHSYRKCLNLEFGCYNCKHSIKIFEKNSEKGYIYVCDIFNYLFETGPYYSCNYFDKTDSLFNKNILNKHN